MKIIKETSRAGDEEVDAASTTIPESVHRLRRNIEQMVNFFNDQLESREADMNWFRSELDRLRFQNEQLGKEKDVEVEKRKKLELDSKELCYKTTDLWDKFQDFKRIQG
jgi:ABC-type phosphate transport system auxiliary subunit